jgi:CHAT domain-containing protein
VSSYAPSLSTIIKARTDWKPIRPRDLSTLLVAEPAAPGQAPLDTVQDEVLAVVKLFERHHTNVTHIDGSVVVPTVEAVLGNIPNHRVLHLACHGQQTNSPLDSCFMLRDGSLTISEVMKMNLSHAFLAYLSACETAKSDIYQPDQAIHLAASMLFCGFRSVIATMW